MILAYMPAVSDQNATRRSNGHPIGAENTTREVLDHLRRVGSVSVTQLGEHLGVTGPAVRQRLTRLMAEGLVDRVLERDSTSRGRPSYRYQLTDKGRRVAGDNFSDLASILWEEIWGIEDRAIRAGLLKRLAKRLAETYTDSIGEGDLATKMQDLTRLMAEREVPFEVDESGQLPIITALACPYPTLAEHDRSICAMERMMMSEVLGESVRLSECRLDSGECCSFEPSTAAKSAAVNSAEDKKGGTK